MIYRLFVVYTLMGGIIICAYASYVAHLGF